MVLLAYYFLSEFASATLCTSNSLGCYSFRIRLSHLYPTFLSDITRLFPAASQHCKAASCSEFVFRRSFDLSYVTSLGCFSFRIQIPRSFEFIFLCGVTGLLFFRNLFPPISWIHILMYRNLAAFLSESISMLLSKPLRVAWRALSKSLSLKKCRKYWCNFVGFIKYDSSETVPLNGDDVSLCHINNQ